MPNLKPSYPVYVLFKIIMPLICLVSICLSTLLLLSSCSSEERLPGYVYFRLNADVPTLDPALITDVSNASIAAKLYNGLVMLGHDLSPVPDIAEHWEIKDRGRLYRFFLRKNAVFANGRIVTSHDFSYSFKRIMDKNTPSPNRWVFERVESINAVDDFLFEIRLKESFAPFLSMLTMPAAYVVPQEEVKRLGRGFSFNPMGSGPYLLEKWLPGREIRLKAREGYITSSDAPRGIIYRIIPDDITAVTEFETGNLDVVGLPSSAFSRFSSNPRWLKNRTETRQLNTYYLGMNTEIPPFNNPKLRRAVAMAIDREKILGTFMEGRGRIASGIVPDLLRVWNGEKTVQYDPEKSRQILHSLGKKEIEAVMLITADQEVADMAEIIQHYLKEVGIQISIRQMEWSAFKETVNRGGAQMFWLSWWADYPEAENFLYPLFHSSNKGYGGNRTRYANKTVDKLLERARTATSKGESNELYKRAEEIVLAEAPMIPFWHRTDYTLRQDWIGGIRSYPVYTMDKGVSLQISHKGALR